jgi:hypothetical protein
VSTIKQFNQRVCARLDELDCPMDEVDCPKRVYVCDWTKLIVHWTKLIVHWTKLIVHDCNMLTSWLNSDPLGCRNEESIASVLFLLLFYCGGLYMWVI